MGNVEELFEKMGILSVNPDMRVRMGLAARNKLENEFSLARYREKLVDLYNELLVFRGY